MYATHSPIEMLQLVRHRRNEIKEENIPDPCYSVLRSLLYCIHVGLVFDLPSGQGCFRGIWQQESGEAACDKENCH